MKSNLGQGASVRSPIRSNAPADNNMNNQSNHTSPVSSSGQPKNNTSKSMKSRVLQIVAYTLLVVFGLGIGGGSYVWFGVLSKIGYSNTPFVKSGDYAPIDLSQLDADQITNGDTTDSWTQGGHTKVYVNSDFPIKKVAQKDKDVENILIFGVDSRGSDDVRCRADAVLILSIDSHTKSIKLISLMRDSGVAIQGRSSTDKLTHSYAYGGVGLLVNTINENFGLDVQRFVMLDFNSSAELIDLVGGIDIEVKADEVKYANQSINEQNTLAGLTTPFLTQAGYQTLSGVQAIAWARIRHADSDFVRTSRQRTVASSLMKKVAAQNTLVQLSLLKDSAGMFETNMTQTDLIRIGTVVAQFIGNIVEYRIPDDGLFTVQENPWMMLIDWDKQIPILHEYIWGRSDI